MKFPTSVHAEGWTQQVYGGGAHVKTNNPALNLKRGFKAGAKPVSLHTPLHGDVPTAATSTARPAVRAQLASHPATPPAFASAAPAAPAAAGATGGATPPRSSHVPWVVGAGVGVLLIGGVVVMSQNISLSTPAPASPGTPVVVGQVTPSAEDAQLQSNPPSAGDPPTPVAEVAAPEAATDGKPTVPVTPAPTALAPQADQPGQPQVWAARPADKAQAPQPVIRTLTPPPEALAQVSPSLVRPSPMVTPQAAVPLSAAPSVLPAAPADAASAAALPQATAPSTAPVTPPVVAQQAPATPDPMDVNITVQVRQALAADATLATVPIAVSTDHGVVKLEGQAPDVQARDRATVVASNTTGVKAVDNRLTLPPVASLDRSPASSGS